MQNTREQDSEGSAATHTYAPVATDGGSCRGYMTLSISLSSSTTGVHCFNFLSFSMATACRSSFSCSCFGFWMPTVWADSEANCKQ